MLDFLEQTVKNYAVLTVKHLAHVTKLRGNVKVYVNLCGLNVNVKQVCMSDRLEILVLLAIVLLALDLKVS